MKTLVMNVAESTLAANGGSLVNRVARMAGRSRPAPNTVSGAGIIIAAMILAITALTLFGQAPARPTFEVISLKPIPQSGPHFGTPEILFRCRAVDGIFHAGTSARTDAIAAVPQGRCVGIVHPQVLVAEAYDIPSERISSRVGWPEPNYQIEAKAENTATVTKDQLRQMLQSLLAERYSLKMHRETKLDSGYILRVAKNGPRFKETSDDEEIQPLIWCQLHPSEECRSNLMTIYIGKFRFGTFAESLSAFTAGRVPVIDKTGLPGVYELRLTLNEDESACGVGKGGAQSCGPFYDPPLSKALEDQLGLTLESGKVPLDYIVVDQIKKPSGN